MKIFFENLVGENFDIQFALQPIVSLVVLNVVDAIIRLQFFPEMLLLSVVGKRFKKLDAQRDDVL